MAGTQRRLRLSLMCGDKVPLKKRVERAAKLAAIGSLVVCVAITAQRSTGTGSANRFWPSSVSCCYSKLANARKGNLEDILARFRRPK